MQTRFLIAALLIILLINACSAQPLPPAEQNFPAAPASQVEPVEPVPQLTPELESEPVQDAIQGIETVPPNCLGGAVSPIGQSIAEEYESASYDQVLTWFCNGAEFEDILVALETESQTDTSADEMLQMLASGFSWEEIWQITGLTD
jgi:hypothetical protein